MLCINCKQIKIIGRQPYSAFSESHLRLLRDGSVNSSVVAYLKKQGEGGHSPSLCTLVWELLYWCHHRNIHIQVGYFPGKLNVSRQSHPDRILPTEWSLDRGITYRFSNFGVLLKWISLPPD